MILLYLLTALDCLLILWVSVSLCAYIASRSGLDSHEVRPRRWCVGCLLLHSLRRWGWQA